MATRKEVIGFGMPWEDVYGYAQAVKVDDTIYVSGQLSHDADGNMVGAAPPDMEAQMRQTYANAKNILAKFGATLDDVVEEVIYVTDMDTAFAAAGPVRKEAYGSARPAVASTILVTSRLALAAQLIEIKFVAKTKA
jgi:enamine deaminase RidA (YjgF/YER057c/UK114 family)